MRYKIKIKHRGENVGMSRCWFVKRSNVVGFQMHREDGAAYENIIFSRFGTYVYADTSYYLRGHRYKNRYTWRNALKYKSYSKNNKGMI